ncbi:hypothetical protein FKM82_016187 [Ascaphus truei]
MCSKSATSPHCFGQSGECPLTNLDSFSGVWYQHIRTLYAFSFNVEQMELLAAACRMCAQSSSSRVSPKSVSHFVMQFSRGSSGPSGQTTSLYILQGFKRLLCICCIQQLPDA